MSDVLMRVTAVDYTTEDDKPIVQLAGRGEDGSRVVRKVTGCIPYFYTTPEEARTINNHEGANGVSGGYESYDGVELYRVNVRVPANCGSRGDAEDLTELVDETWESDIPFYRRCSIDYGLSGHIRVPDSFECHITDIETDVDVGGDLIDPRIMIADIEVLNKGSVSYDDMMDDYSCPITHIGVWDSQADEYIVLHLDPDRQVDSGEVSDYLTEHTAAEALADELERDIHIRRYATEKKLLDGFISLCMSRRFDLASGWNFVDFDWDYLLGRIDEVDTQGSIHALSDIGHLSGFHTERRVDCFPAFDMMFAYTEKMSFSNWRSSALDYVAKEVLGVGKIEDINIAQEYEDNRSRLLAYNIMDVMLCVLLDRKEGIHDFFYELAEISQIQIYDTFSEMRLVDGYIMSRSSDDEILPPQEEKDIPENAGGLVLKPSDGVADWIGVIDLKSLYPSAMLTWNISPETIHWYDDKEPEEPYINVPWLPDAEYAEGGEFGADEIDFDVMWADLSEEGLIPKYLKRLFPERDEKKAKRNQYDPSAPEYDVWDRKQFALKVIMNAFYGVSSNDYWRLGMYGLGDGITSASRFALWKGKEITEAEGYDVYYGDTDSVLIELGDEGAEKAECIERGEALEATVNDRMGECVEWSGLTGAHPHLDDDLHGTDRHCLTYEFEKLYRRFFQAGKKKRYAGNIVWKEGKDVDGEIDITGFQSERSDSPEITSEVQPEVINRILAGEAFSGVSEYVRDLIDQIRDGEIELYKVGLPGTINKPIEEYSNTQIIRGVRYSNEVLDAEWRRGDDPWVYKIDSTPPMTPGTDVLALGWGEDLPERFELDVDATVERGIKKPLMPILDEMGWRWDEIKQGAQTESAADWEVTGDYPDPEPTDDADGTDKWGW